MSLGSRIRKLRESKNISQVEMAKILNVANSTLSQYETNQRVPSDDIKIKIADYFNVSIDYLLGRSDDPEKGAPGYYIDQETTAMAQEIFNNPDLRILFDASRNLKGDDIKAVTDLMQRLKGEEE